MLIAIKSVGQLVANDCADGAIVDRSICTWLVKRWLHNRCGNVDVVCLRVIGRINRSRQGGLIGETLLHYWFANLGQVTAQQKLSYALLVTVMVVRADINGAEIDPVLRIAHLNVNLGQLC
jgi:hypothetical protein